MNLTKEQQNVLELVLSNKHSLIKIAAVAGSGKTHTLRAIAQAYKPKRGLYTAFNKAIVAESAEAFDSSIECKTLHAIAYHYIIRKNPIKRQIEEFTYSCIKEDVGFDIRMKVRNAMDKFFNSGELHLTFFDQYDKQIADLAKKYIGKMVNNEIPVTFGFLIKYFLLQLSNGMKVEPYDLLMLDEAGDVTEVTLEIFKLLPAKQKVMVGDPMQNIYTFMDTVNGFVELWDQGLLTNLTTTFRVKAPIARKIERYMQSWINSEAKFVGLPNQETEIKSHAYISRTNSGLVARIIKLQSQGHKYKLLRDPYDIFALPISLIMMKPSRPPSKKEHMWIYKELLIYNKDKELQKHYNTFFSYLRSHFIDDVPLKVALGLITKYGASKIFEAYNEAKTMATLNHSNTMFTLATAHTSKGLTFDSVFIEDDLNTTVMKAMEAVQQGDEREDTQEELRLGYVGATRCRIKLLNATFLHWDESHEEFLADYNEQYQ